MNFLKSILILLICFFLILFFSCEIKNQENIDSPPWVKEELYTSTNLNDVFFLNEDYGWIVGDNGTIFKYYEQRWHFTEPDVSDNLRAVHIVDYDNTWVIGDNGTILNYRADTFIRYNSPITVKLIDIHMLDSITGWIVGGKGTILEYYNDEWVDIGFPNIRKLSIFLTQIDFYNDSNGIIVGDAQTIIRFRNGWQDVSPPENTQMYRSVCMVDTNVFFIGSFFAAAGDYCIGISYFPGDINLYSKSGTANHITSIKVRNNSGWAVGRTGDILKYDCSTFDFYKTIDSPLNSMFLVNDTLGWIVGGAGTLLKL